MNVAVLGASNKPHRYSYKAVQMLIEHGHTVYPVHPVIKRIGDLEVWADLGDVHRPIDTLTLYLSAANSDRAADGILAAGARRVIFNPGAENPPLAARLRERGAETLDACTLVLLRTGQF